MGHLRQEATYIYTSLKLSVDGQTNIVERDESGELCDGVLPSECYPFTTSSEK